MVLNISIRVTYIEIYNEKIYDLLNKRHELKIQESGPGGLNIGCAERMVTTEKEIMDLVSEGTNFRKVAETNMNVQSSRSHTIFSIVSVSFVARPSLAPNTMTFCDAFPWPNRSSSRRRTAPEPMAPSKRAH